MNRCLFHLLILITVSLAQLQANAAGSENIGEAVNQSLSIGTGHAAIITSLTASPFNLTLEQATAAAIEAGGDSHAEAFAAAGIAAATSLPQAESVAEAARATSGQTRAAVDVAMEEYVRLMDQPYIHHDGTIPTGGGAYDDGTGQPGGGTRPPLGGVRPPVSPDS